MIIMQRRDPRSSRPNRSGRHDFWAGDGDDIVFISENWRYGYGWGGRGDDTLHLPETFRDAKYYGGLGNDSFVAIREVDAEASNADTNRNILLSGDAGNDQIEGPHLTGNSVLKGGADDDKIVGGNDNDT